MIDMATRSGFWLKSFIWRWASALY